MRVLTALLTLLCPVAQAAGTPAHLEYLGFIAGLPAMTAQADVLLADDGYRVAFGYRTSGLVGAFFHADLHSLAVGAFDGLAPQPQRFTAWGRFRGTDRQTLIDYPDRTPRVRVLQPAIDREREPIPQGAERDSVDTLSALAMLVRAVAQTGGCDGATRIFDGRRLSEVTARTAGRDVLPPDADSIYAGPALRCAFSGRLLAGYLLDEDRARQAEPQEGVAWIAAPAPGLPLLPVRIQFRLRLFGTATAYLTAAHP